MFYQNTVLLFPADWEILSVKVMWCFDILSTVNNAGCLSDNGEGGV